MSETASPAPRWSQLSTNGHSVQFYEEDAVLLDGLARFVGAAVGAGDPVVIIATEAHRTGLAERLVGNGLDLPVAVSAGRYVALDAAETLSSFMVNGHPDRVLFLRIAGRLIAAAAEARSSTGRYVAAFGEMVALLWAEGNSQAAIELEGLWNELAESYAFYLHCAYPSTLFVAAGDAEPLAAICAKHTHLIDKADGNAELSDERFQKIAVEQRHVTALWDGLQSRRPRA